MNKWIKSVDDLPKEAIYSVKMLRNLFKGTSFEQDVNETFLRNYNEAKEKGF